VSHHSRSVGRIPQVDDQRGQVIERSARGFEQRRQILEYPVYLVQHVSGVDDLTFRVDAGRSREIDMASIGVIQTGGTLEGHTIFVRPIQVIQSVDEHELAFFETQHRQRVEGNETMRAGVLSLDAGGHDVVRIRGQSFARKKLPARRYHSCVVHVHVLHEDPGAQRVLEQGSSLRGEVIAVGREQFSRLLESTSGLLKGAGSTRSLAARSHLRRPQQRSFRPFQRERSRVMAGFRKLQDRLFVRPDAPQVVGQKSDLPVVDGRLLDAGDRSRLRQRGPVSQRRRHDTIDLVRGIAEETTAEYCSMSGKIERFESRVILRRHLLQLVLEAAVLIRLHQQMDFLGTLLRPESRDPAGRRVLRADNAH